MFYGIFSKVILFFTWLTSLAALLYATSLSLISLRNSNSAMLKDLYFHMPNLDEFEEVQFLPKPEFVKAISLGYQNVLGELIWFYTQNYFGKHYRSDQKYTWLYHMCDLITTLDPNHKEIFSFGATILGWEARKPEEAHKLLAKGIVYHPTYWYFYFLRGSLYYLVQDKPKKAIEDFKIGATLPNAPAMMSSLAAKKMVKVNKDPEGAIIFLEEMIATSSDPQTKDILQNKILEIKRKSLTVE